MRIGALLPTIALATGIIIASIAKLAWWWGCALIAAAAAAYMLMMRGSGTPVKALRMGKWHALWVAALFAGIGILDESLNRPMTLQEASGGNIPAMISGEVTNILTKTYGDRLEVTLEGTNGAAAQIRTGATTFKEGDIITFPSSRLIPLASDSSAMMRRLAPMLEPKGILYHAFIPAKDLRLAGHSLSLRHLCSEIRNSIEIKIEKSGLRRPAADFLKAILMGDKSGLDEQTRLTFAQGGTAHILALSGLHMGILAGMLMWLAWPARAAGRYKWGYALAIALLWCYVCVTGMSHSSVRACIMITFAFAAVIAERKNGVGNALCSACLIILLMNPAALFDAGFQLSVVCVGALIAFASRLNPLSHRNHPRLYRICEALLATMVATLASLPFTSYYFSQVPLMFLPVNVLLLPLLPAYLCAGAAYTALLCAGYEATPLGAILDHGHQFMVWATETLSGGSAYLFDVQIPLPALILWILLLSSGAWILNRNGKTS